MTVPVLAFEKLELKSYDYVTSHAQRLRKHTNVGF